MALTPKFINPHAQGSRTIWPQPMDGDAAQSATGAVGAATTISVTGQTGRKIVISELAWSYSTAPTGGAITVQDTAGSPATYFDLHVTASGPGSITFTPPLALPVGLGATITLAAPGGTVVGKLFASAYVNQ